MKKIIFSLLLGLFLLPLSVGAMTLNEFYDGHLPSIEDRVPLAEDCGILNYRGTLKQNIALLKCLLAEEFLGAGYTPITGYQSRTTQYISSTATTIPVASTKDKASNAISLSNISSSSTVKVYFNLEPGTAREEPVVCTGVTASSWTNCTRGLTFQGSGETSSTTIAVAHNAGSVIIITNVGQFYNQYIAVDGAQQVNGVITFIAAPVVPTPTAATQAVNKSYADGLSFAGSPTSTFSNLGQTQLATQIQIASSTASSTAGAPLVVSTKWTTSTCPSSDLYVPVTSNNGKLSSTCIDQTANYTWTGQHTLSGSATTTITATTSFGGMYQGGDWGGISPVGSITAYAGTATPTGWAFSNGQALSRTSYSRLFAVIGTTYGTGDGATTFNIPNIQNRKITMASSSVNVGQTGGESNHTMTTSELVAHTHDIPGDQPTAGTSRIMTATNNNNNTQSTASTGGSVPFNVLDPYIVMNYLIRIQ